MLGSLLQAGASIIGGLFGKEGQEDTNTANAELARESREWQERMRDTTYQSTVKDLQAAGLNPMLGYSKPNTTPSAPNVAKMENASAAGVNGAMAALNMQQATAGIEKTRAETEQIRAQKILTEAQVPATTTSTANVAQQTENLKATISNIQEELQNLVKKGYNLTEEGNESRARQALLSAQKSLTHIQEELASKQINNVEAQTRTQNVLTTLRNAEVAGAKNLEAWEKATSDPTAGNVVKGIGAIANTARAVLGK